MPFFSVIIPTYNRSELLRHALASVWAQTFTDFEVVVVDDGSSDCTADFLCSLGERVRLITQSNLGPGAARNAGAQQARGEYLAFLDSDDLWLPWTLACFAELTRQHQNPAILGAKLVEFSNESKLKMVADMPLQADVFADYFESHRTGYFVGAGMSALRRDAFFKSGGYTDKRINGEDHDLILRMGDARGFVQITSPITLGWRRHVGSATMNLRRSVMGSLYLVEQERCGAYPGGTMRCTQRREIISRNVRPVSLRCMQEGAAADGWRLYRATCRWNTALGRWRYLFGFPLKALFPK